MTEQEQIEQHIRELLATETNPVALSEQLFSEAGLFSQLGKTAEERRVIIQSPLFNDALDRFHELQDRDAEALGQDEQLQSV